MRRTPPPMLPVRAGTCDVFPLLVSMVEVGRGVDDVDRAEEATLSRLEVCCTLIELEMTIENVENVEDVLLVGLFIPQGNAILFSSKSSTNDAGRRFAVGQ